MEINSKKLDELYKEWSGEHHTTNSNKQVHDSAECTDFAEHCLKWAVSEGEMIPTRNSNCNIPIVSHCICSNEHKHGETSVMCCNECGLPTEKFWYGG